MASKKIPADLPDPGIDNTVQAFRWVLPLFFSIGLTGCDFGTDAATRLSHDIETGASRLRQADGAKYSIRHTTPSKSGECNGPYKLQVDKVGALIIWCKDAGGRIVSSHSTSYHARFVTTSQTFIVEKPSGAPVTIDLERRYGQAVITQVQ